jgi:RND family efflux transporter MFP subunit
MRRIAVWVVTAAVVIALGVVGYRWRRSMVGSRLPKAPAAMTTAAQPAISTPPGTPRGEVSIDPRRQQLTGVRTARVVSGSIDERVRTTGAVRYDETRLVDVNVKIEGYIRDLYVDYTGQPVRKGQQLFTLYSPDLLNTEKEYLLALKTRDQMEQSTIADARQRADALVSAARERLSLWDLPDEDIRAIENNRRAEAAVVFRSPASGFVLEKQAVRGLHVMPGQTLYRIADVSTVWVEADVHENEVAAIRVGSTATVVIDAYPNERFTGRAVYIYPYVDEKARTNRVRFAFANPRGRLKPGMYATVELKTASGTGLMVPADAVLDSGTEQVVFVAQGNGIFEPRNVKIGRRLGESIQIAEGLQEGDQVATGAAFFLDSESQLRGARQGYEATSATPGGSTATAQLDIAFRTVPDPARTGENEIEVVLKDAAGTPVDGAQVSVQLFMAAMPTMNMPAQRSETTLAAGGSGVYRGTGQVMTAGRWDATVTVTRNGQRVGTKNLSLVAR